MSQKIWQKTGSQKLNTAVETFTIGVDYLLDTELVPYDVQGSIAHAEMLQKIGILSKKELQQAVKGLQTIEKQWKEGRFKIHKDQEDCHSAIEAFLTEHCGDVGKKIHTGRSRNDQILVTLRLYTKEQLLKITAQTQGLIKTLQKRAMLHKKTLMPGYTHMQRAMPSTVHMWLESFAESLKDDLELLKTASKIIDQNPLGSAAGFGESILGLDRAFTTKKLGFAKTQNNPMYCALSRGKFENIVLQALSQIVFTIGKIASDLLLFTTKEFDFFSLPDAFRTGSSIMPQKKNYDVLELLRGNVGLFNGYQYQVQSIIQNLPSGYNRDFQLTKEPYMKALKLAQDMIEIGTLIVESLRVHTEKLAAACSPELYATDDVYKLVKKGVHFREAYREVGKKYM